MLRADRGDTGPAGPGEAAAGSAAPAATEAFDFGDLAGEIAAAHRPVDLEAEVRRLIDPPASADTVHYRRNFLYRTELAGPAGDLEVVVKLFRGDTFKDRLRRRLRGTKAARSWRVAQRMIAAGIPTPEPVLVVESRRSGASWYVCRSVGRVYRPAGPEEPCPPAAPAGSWDALEARHLLRAARAGCAATSFPEVDLERFLGELGRLLRRLHDAGIWHRDVSVGNVLIRPGGAGAPPRLDLIDLNRARCPARMSLSRRCRDMCRLALFRRRDQEAFLAAYWGGEPGPLRRGLFLLYFHSFELKSHGKRHLAPLRRAAALGPRRAHAHIPGAPSGASARDKAVWDHLSDQPHQHASRTEKMAVRLADAGDHLAAAAALVAAVPRIWRRYRQLRRQLYAGPVPWDGVGLALRPWGEDPAALLAAVEGLGVRRLLLRLHPWQDDHRREEELAGELVARGYELAFALPQNRELVRDPERWRRAVGELAERFTPFGRHFQVGQAVNRSKWGIWRYQEYVELAIAARDELLRRRDDVEVLGPAVIDFEYHVTAAVLNLRRPGFRFDAVASLLYVDRRGAPENTQMGFDTVGKVVLLKALADTARNAAGRSWITEVNWPLWEGPHSPAGKSVAVSEEAQADYLVRYYLLTLTTGLVERVYWWQLIARGYGLMSPGEGGALRRRPAYHALATLERQLAGATALGPLPAAGTARLHRFRRADGRELVVAWNAAAGPQRVHLPRPAVEVVGRDGEALPPPPSREVEVVPSPRYYLLAAE